MIKAKAILDIKPYSITCSFNNGEVRRLDVEKVLSKENKYVQEILTLPIFSQAKIGEFGELYWEDVAKMKDLNGNEIPCAFDPSPEFVYFHATRVG
ncbi:MAG: hypothetical protein ABIO44_02300 [Saprospiraceae bacterium]